MILFVTHRVNQMMQILCVCVFFSFGWRSVLPISAKHMPNMYMYTYTGFAMCLSSVNNEEKQIKRVFFQPSVSFPIDSFKMLSTIYSMLMKTLLFL